MLKISGIITTDQGVTALLKAIPNLESLVFVNCMNDVVEDSDEEDESVSDEDDSDSAEGDGVSVEGANNYNNGDEGDGDDDCEDHDANSVEGANYHNNEDEGAVADAAECSSSDQCEDNYDSENESWALDIVTTGCLFPHLKSVCFQQFAGKPKEMKWVRLILRDAKALQKITTVTPIILIYALYIRKVKTKLWQRYQVLQEPH
ncbi:hypothetical protein MKW98_031103 [Papaver atlanticum]|uniref:FBD domain-containing protein n=1 Tax=Papaver atlanticum TaxID=357466 RepID=A0AAD4SWQ8_9MAGN|nr:hypothetical protein MKW98_031103 [Papaver atlanticum]